MQKTSVFATAGLLHFKWQDFRGYGPPEVRGFCPPAETVLARCMSGFPRASPERAHPREV